jgi:hypothetical protein
MKGILQRQARPLLLIARPQMYHDDALRSRASVGWFSVAPVMSWSWSCSPVSTPYNHALALFRSRLTRTGVIPGSPPFSSTQSAEVTKFTTRDWRASSAASDSSASFRASISIPRACAPSNTSSSGTRSVWPPRLAYSRPRAWSTRTRRMICEQRARKCMRFSQRMLPASNQLEVTFIDQDGRLERLAGGPSVAGRFAPPPGKRRTSSCQAPVHHPRPRLRSIR